jgi:protein-disulfide isomerase
MDMKRYLLLFLTLILSTELYALEPARIHQIAYGKKEAPVTVIEYTSLTCSHCADFHLHVLPLIKEKYIDTNEIRFIIKPLPLDKDSLMAFKLVHSLPLEQQEMAVTKLYSSQRYWIGKPAETAGRMLGLTPEQCKAAMDNTKLENELLSGTYTAQKQLNVEATPTFFINDVKSEGAPTMEEFEKLYQENKNPKKAPTTPVAPTRMN